MVGIVPYEPSSSRVLIVAHMSHGHKMDVVLRVLKAHEPGKNALAGHEVGVWLCAEI